MNKALALTVFVLGTAFAGIAAADAPVVNARQAEQRERVDGGVASGELPRREAAGLRAQQAHVRQEEREAKADGVVTRRGLAICSANSIVPARPFTTRSTTRRHAVESDAAGTVDVPRSCR